MSEKFDNFNNIFFSNVSDFHLNRTVNCQNCCYWAEVNPTQLHKLLLHSPKETV